jgi:hypothetical protein
LGPTSTDQNSIQEEIESRLKFCNLLLQQVDWRPVAAIQPYMKQKRERRTENQNVGVEFDLGGAA